LGYKNPILDLHDMGSIELAACPTEYAELLDPHPIGINSSYGNVMVVLSTGNVVVTKPNDNLVAATEGAVYLFNAEDGSKSIESNEEGGSEYFKH